jgi:Ca2+-binding RTX toxin-like protein
MSVAAVEAIELRCAGEDLQRSPATTPDTAIRGPVRARGAAPANARVNDPTLDPSVQDGTHITQNEVSVAFSGSAAVVGYNDTTHLLDGGSFSITGYARSADGGATWQDRGELASAGGTTIVAGDPVLAARPDGTVFFANLFLTGTQSTDRQMVGVSTSNDGGLTFGAPSETWPTMLPSEAADKPWIAVDDSPTSPRSGRVYVAWANFLPSGDSPIMLTSSADGATWSPPVAITDPTCAPSTGTPHAAQGIQLDVAANGDLHAAWLCFGGSALQIRHDRSIDGGLTWGTDHVVRSFTNPSGEAVINCGTAQDPEPTLVYHGNIRWNDFPSMAIDPTTGAVHLVWTEDPDGFGSGIDDAAVFYSRSTDAGGTWSAPVVLGANPLDQFFPVIRTAADGTVAAAWYDRRNDPNNLAMDMYATSSRNGGATFSAVERITTTSFGVPQLLPNYDTFPRDCYMGDYNGMAPTSAGSFLIGWGDNRDPGPAANAGVDQNVFAAVYAPPLQPSPEPGPGPGPGPSGACDVTGTAGRDRLRGTSAAETICGLGGADTLSGLAGDDVLKGGGGADVLRGGPGRDRLLGGSGPDRCPGSRDTERSCER